MTETAKVVARTAADPPAVRKVRENFAAKAESLEHRREGDLRADKVAAVGNKRSQSAAAPDEDSQRKGERQTVGGALALATEDRNEVRVEEGLDAGGEAPTVIRVASAGERGAQSALTKAKNLPRPAEKATVAEADYEPASANFAKQKESDAPPALPADRLESGEQTPTLQASLEMSEAVGVFRGGGDELRRTISQTETERDAKDDSQLVPARDADLSLLPVGLLDEQAEIGVAADGSMSIRTLDSATNTVTITHVYLP